MTGLPYIFYNSIIDEPAISSEISCPGKRHRYLACFAYLNGTDGVVLRARDEYLEDVLHDGVWIGKQEYRFLSHGPFPTSPHELARRINDPPPTP